MRRGVGAFVAVAYALVWAGTALTWLTGSVWPMWLVGGASPAVAGVVCRARFHEGPVAAPLGVSLKINRWFWIAWLATPVVALAVLVLTAALPWTGIAWDGAGFLVDAALPAEGARLLREAASEQPVGPLVPGVFAALAGGVTTFGLAALGEEIGWRGFLQEELAPLGFWRSSLVTGLVWGAWHLPFIAIGSNSPGSPLTGFVTLVLFCAAASPLLALVRERSGSVLPCAAAHGTWNAAMAVTLPHLTAAWSRFAFVLTASAVCFGVAAALRRWLRPVEPVGPEEMHAIGLDLEGGTPDPDAVSTGDVARPEAEAKEGTAASDAPGGAEAPEAPEATVPAADAAGPRWWPVWAPVVCAFLAFKAAALVIANSGPPRIELLKDIDPERVRLDVMPRYERGPSGFEPELVPTIVDIISARRASRNPLAIWWGERTVGGTTSFHYDRRSGRFGTRTTRSLGWAMRGRGDVLEITIWLRDDQDRWTGVEYRYVQAGGWARLKGPAGVQIFTLPASTGGEAGVLLRRMKALARKFPDRPKRPTSSRPWTGDELRKVNEMLEAWGERWPAEPAAREDIPMEVAPETPAPEPESEEW